MNLYFIRHGETDWNIDGKIQGSINTPLNETGIQQTKLLAENIMKSDRNIHRFYN